MAKLSEYFLLKAFLATIVVFCLLIAGCRSGSDDSSDDDSSDNGGASEVTIQASTPLEDFSPLTVTYTASVDEGTVLSAQWDFGDGNVMFTGDDSPVTHTYTQSGKYQGKVTLEVTSASASLQTLAAILPEVNVLPDVNLVVSSFAIDREVTAASLETVSAIIQNIGSETLDASGFLHVGYYLSTDSNITVDDIYIGDTSIVIGDFFEHDKLPFNTQNIGPGQSFQYDHQLAVKGNIPTGTYFAGAIVDYIDEYYWYVFPRATDTSEYPFPVHIVVPESNEKDNVRVLDAYRVAVNNAVCADDSYENDDDNASATLIRPGESQVHNFCLDNSDWLKFDAVEGSAYKLTTFNLDVEVDTQLILYDQDGASVLLFHDNMGNTPDETRTVDLDREWPPIPSSEIVWEAKASGVYYVKVRTTTCDEDLDDHCLISPDGVGLNTGYTVSLQ